MEGNFYTPTEIVNRNPILLQRNWTAQNIGYLYNCHLLNGIRKSRCTYLDEASVLRLFFINFPTLLIIKQPSPLV